MKLPITIKKINSLPEKKELVKEKRVAKRKLARPEAMLTSGPVQLYEGKGTVDSYLMHIYGTSRGLRRLGGIDSLPYIDPKLLGKDFMEFLKTNNPKMEFDLTIKTPDALLNVDLNLSTKQHELTLIEYLCIKATKCKNLYSWVRMLQDHLIELTFIKNKKGAPQPRSISAFDGFTLPNQWTDFEVAQIPEPGEPVELPPVHFGTGGPMATTATTTIG